MLQYSHSFLMKKNVEDGLPFSVLALAFSDGDDGPIVEFYHIFTPEQGLEVSQQLAERVSPADLKRIRQTLLDFMDCEHSEMQLRRYTGEEAEVFGLLAHVMVDLVDKDGDSLFGEDDDTPEQLN